MSSRTTCTREELADKLEELHLHDYMLDRAYDSLLFAMEKEEH